MASIIARCSRLSCVWGGGREGEGGGGRRGGGEERGGGRGGGQCKFGTIRRSKLSPQNRIVAQRFSG